MHRINLALHFSTFSFLFSSSNRAMHGSVSFGLRLPEEERMASKVCNKFEMLSLQGILEVQIKLVLRFFLSF